MAEMDLEGDEGGFEEAEMIKISAIGAPEFARKDSPFWENDNIFELHSSQLYGKSSKSKKGNHRRVISDDEFLR